MQTRLVACGALVIALVGSATAAAAQSPNGEDKNCWGVVTSQLAAVGGLGEHSSQKEEPRVGLGNLARDLGFAHISEMGTFLAEVDEIEATECS
jgi:hypothetical protein